MSTKGAAASGKPHDYKAHFTRTRSKYEKVMEVRVLTNGSASASCRNTRRTP